MGGSLSLADGFYEFANAVVDADIFRHSGLKSKGPGLEARCGQRVESPGCQAGYTREIVRPGKGEPGLAVFSVYRGILVAACCIIIFCAYGAQTIQERREIFHELRLNEHLDPYNPVLAEFAINSRAALERITGDPAAAKSMSLHVLDNLRLQQASSLAHFDVFWVVGVISFVLVFLVMFVKPSAVENGARRRGRMSIGMTRDARTHPRSSEIDPLWFYVRHGMGSGSRDRRLSCDLQIELVVRFPGALWSMTNSGWLLAFTSGSL